MKYRRKLMTFFISDKVYWIARKYWLVGLGGGWVFAARLPGKTLRLVQHI